MRTMANISTEEKYRRQALSFLSEINSARKLLPFHKLCIPKYEALGIPFRCADIPECDGETIERLSKLL